MRPINKHQLGVLLMAPLLESCAYTKIYPENKFEDVGKNEFKSVRLLDSANKEVIKGSCLYIDADTLKVCTAFSWKSVPKTGIEKVEVRGNRIVDATRMAIFISISAFGIIAGAMIVMAMSAL